MFKKSISVLKQEGISGLISGARRVFRRNVRQFRMALRVRRALYRGQIRLSVGETTAIFVAENSDSVRMTIRRWQSERERLTDILQELCAEDIFYDIGANTGLYTCFAAKQCSHIVAFEPHPQNFVELRQNASRNGGNVTVMDLALSDTAGTVGLSLPSVDATHYPDGDSPGFGGAAITEETSDIEVDTVRGDQLVDDGVIHSPNVVKIDVEGAEPKVIKGLTSALRNPKCRFVDCEGHRAGKSSGSEAGGVDDAELVSQFEDLDFDDVYVVEDLGSTFVVRAIRE